MKRVTRLLPGVAALIASAGFCFIAIQYLFDGAGVQVLGFGVSTTTVSVGWIHLMGFILAAAIAFALGLWWCADGLMPHPPANPEKNEQKTPDDCR